MNSYEMTEKMSKIINEGYAAVAIPLAGMKYALELINSMYEFKDRYSMVKLVSGFLHDSGVENPAEYALSLVKGKSHDYAGNEDAMANFKLCSTFGIKPSAGIITRLADKISRIYNLMESGDDNRQIKDESIKDTMIDAANYTAILWLWLTEQELINFENEIGEKEYVSR